MTEAEYIEHLQELGLSEDVSKSMADQAITYVKYATPTAAVWNFTAWIGTKEGWDFWYNLACALGSPTPERYHE